MTGASRGLGAEIAAALAADGATVVLLARDGDALDCVASSIGPAAEPVLTDITDPAAVSRAFAYIAERHGRLDVLVNNAGVGQPHTLNELGDEALLAQVAVNLLGPLYCMRAALDLLRQAGGGDVINISSVAVTNPYPMMWLYSATKAALEVASTALAEELHDDGIRVSVLRVGSMAGTSFAAGWDEERRQRAAEIARAAGRERFAGGAPVDPQGVARWVVELAALGRDTRIGLIDIRPN